MVFPVLSKLAQYCPPAARKEERLAKEQYLPMWSPMKIVIQSTIRGSRVKFALGRDLNIAVAASGTVEGVATGEDGKNQQCECGLEQHLVAC